MSKINWYLRCCTPALIILALALQGCRSLDDQQAAISRGAAAPLTPVTFKDQTAELGLTNPNGDGACWVDIDNDGWTDLCFSGTLWRNLEGKGFAKVFEPGCVIAADFDNDGFADLFSWSQLKLYHNDAGQGFRIQDARLAALQFTRRLLGRFQQRRLCRSLHRRLRGLGTDDLSRHDFDE